MAGDAPLAEPADVLNHELIALRSARDVAQSALDALCPDGRGAAEAVCSLLASAWTSPAADRTVESLSANGAIVRDRFTDVVDRVRELVSAQVGEPRVPHDDPRGNAQRYGHGYGMGRPDYV